MAGLFTTDLQSLRQTPGSAKSWVAAWLPAVFAAGVIAMESTSTFSAHNTSSWLRPIFERWLGPISNPNWELVHHLLRKGGHLCGYSLVALTFLRAWLYTFAGRLALTAAGWRLHSTMAAVASTAFIASVDEWHQSFLPSRTGKVSDVGIDTLGGLLMCAAIWLVFWRGARGSVSKEQGQSEEIA